MNNPFQIFTSPQFGEIRAGYFEGAAFFVGKDVCQALGYKDHKSALRRHVDERDKKRVRIAPPVGSQAAIVINESGLYSLILASHLPAAQEFKHWVTSEVLPNIRKYGTYSLFPTSNASIAETSTRPDEQNLQVIAAVDISDLQTRIEALEMSFQGILDALERNTAVQLSKIERAEKLLAIVEKIRNDEARDKVILHAANLINGKAVF